MQSLYDKIRHLKEQDKIDIGASDENLDENLDDSLQMDGIKQVDIEQSN